MRDTGPIGKSLDGNGDTESATTYMGVARTVLGLLTNDMRANGLKVGTRTANLPDGTSIRVVVVGNNKRVFISTPTAGSGTSRGPEIQLPLSEAATPPVPLPSGIIFVGELDDLGGVANGNAVRWANLNTPNQISFLPGTYTGGAAAISMDGTTIVGSMQGDVGSHGFILSGNTIKDIGGLGSQPDTYISGVSGDGEVLSVSARIIHGVTNYLPHMWRRTTGFVPLDNAGSIYGRTFCVSPNGRYIGGMIFVSIGSQDGSIAALWDNGRLIRLTESTAYGAVYGIADTGRACGTYNNAPVYWEPDGSMVYITATNSKGASAYSITQDGATIVGALNTPVGSFFVSNGTEKGSVVTGASAFIWNARAGVRILGDGGATMIGPRGTIIGGNRATSGTGGTVNTPVLWHRDGARFDMAVLPNTNGTVTGIGGPPA